MPGDIEEEKKQHHAALAGEHERKAEFHKKFSGGESEGGGQPSTGEQAGGFVGALMEHKWLIIGGLAAVIAFVIITGKSSNAGNTSTANTSPDLSQGNYVPANISTALDSINAGMAGLATQMATQSATPGPVGPTGPAGPTGPSGTGGSHRSPPPSSPPSQPPQPQQNFVTVTPWPTALSTLWGISQANGISLARIENLNPQIPNPNLIYPGQRVRVS